MTVDSGQPVADAGLDAGSMDAGVPDAGPMLPPYARTLITRPLMPTSPKNLLRDPFIGGDGATSYGQFRAFFVTGSGNITLPLVRTFQSVSPIGGAASIEELRDLPSDAGTATSARVLSSFHGGAGDFEASVWLSIGDAHAAGLPFSTGSSAVQVSLLDNLGVNKVVLAASAPVTFGQRQWVKYSTTGTTALPSGGWLAVGLTNFALTLQLAAPQVTSSVLGVRTPQPLAQLVPQTDDDRRTLAQARWLDQHPVDAPRRREREDR